MTVLTEGQHTAEFLLSEAQGFRSRAVVTLEAPAADLAAGTVLGVLAGGTYAMHDQDGADGSEAAVAILYDNVKALETPADTQATVLIRDCEVNGNDLIWQADIDAGETATAVAELAALGIIVR